jgi:tRNA 2-selenouridine synthase
LSLDSEKSDQEILSHWDERSLEGLPTFDSIVPKNLPLVPIEEVLKTREKYWILDVRSEKEFTESHLPHAVSFPILDNKERREVGLLYKQRGRDAAVTRAVEFATPKLDPLRQLAQEAVNQGKTPLIYCWRGGGRSAYTTSQLIHMGFKAIRLKGGHKAYRRLVYEALYRSTQPEFLILKGLTGVGKTDLLHMISPTYKVLDLESYARHCASSFGSIPFELKGTHHRTSQKKFEDEIYSTLYLSEVSTSPAGILAESESKRIGHLFVPPGVFEAMTSATTIEVTCSIEKRVERIHREYIGADNSGIPLLQRDLESIRPYISKIQYQNWKEMLGDSRIREVLKELLLEYYDKKYAGIYNEPDLTVDASELSKARDKILEFLKNS